MYPHWKRECQYIFQYLNKNERKKEKTEQPSNSSGIKQTPNVKSLWVTRDGLDQRGILKLGRINHTLMFIPHLSLFNTDGRHKIAELSWIMSGQNDRYGLLC